MKQLTAVLACAALLTGCAAPQPARAPAPDLPAQWYAPPLAHQGSSVALAIAEDILALLKSMDA